MSKRNYRGRENKKEVQKRTSFRFCDLGEARTLDPLIKSQLLYQLSYEVIVVLLISVAKVRLFFELATILCYFFVSFHKKL